MAVSTRSVGGVLAGIVGRDGVSDDPAVLAARAVAGRTPRWVVRPSSTEHVAAVLALASEEGLAVAPRGSGSSLDLGHPPSRLDVVLDLSGLGRILEDQPEDLTVSLEAGVTLGALATRLRTRHQSLPLDPPGAAGRTLGGIAATAASGPLRTRYGTPRDLLLGVRFVQADGVITWGGARVVKSVTGYDVPKLMVGSLGTLGVLTELTLRLHPVPDAEWTWLIRCRVVEAAQAFVLSLLDSTLQPGRVEFLNGTALAACDLGSEGVGVAISIGSVEEAVREQGDRLSLMAREAGLGVERLGASFWDAYERATVAGPDTVALGVATLPSRLGEVVAVVERASRGTAAAAITGSAAVGSLLVGLDASGDVEGTVTSLRESVAADGGSVIVHRVPAALRSRLDPWGPVAPDALALMRRIKGEFDPHGILNPGRFVGGL